MLSIVLYPVRLVASAVLSNDSPRQLALGVMVGMMLGLVPKGNLVACGIGILLLATRINLGTGVFSACGFSWAAVHWDQTAHRLGEKILTYPAAQSMYAAAIEWPLMAWSGLNNTVVLGQLLISLYLAYPVYLIAEVIARKLQPRVVGWLMKYRVGKVLLGLDVMGRVEGN